MALQVTLLCTLHRQASYVPGVLWRRAAQYLRQVSAPCRGCNHAVASLWHSCSMQ